MAYFYSDPSRESDPYALPNVEVFGPMQSGECNRCTSGAMYADQGEQDCDSCPDGKVEPDGESGFYYAFGFPGCLPDGDAVGPFATEVLAIAAARETS